jgi:hypothetical protein
MVLGMHRFGTSALTTPVSLLCPDLPKDMLGANPSNVAGHMESARLIEPNEGMLAEAGRRWDAWGVARSV